MRVCSRCGTPDNGTGVCKNCGGASFIELNGRAQNSHSSAQSVNRTYNQVPQNYNSAHQNYYQGGVPGDYGVRYGAGALQAADTAVKTASKISISKILIIIFACLAVLAAGITIPVVVVKNENTPEKTLEKFEEAFNNADFNAMIECFDSKTRNMYDSGDDILGGVLGFSYKSAMSMIPFLADAMGEEMPKIHIEVDSIDETGDKTCNVNVRMYLDDDSEYDTDTIKMVKESGKWYISDEELLDSF